MIEPHSSVNDYARRGYGEVWEILARGCEIPPSLEVFEQELRERRRGVMDDKDKGLTPSGCARRIVQTYHRTRFSFEEE